ncbi:DUF3015 family protein [Glaciecola sp. MF2-115]|uniref:DUF3015 family protein n=1 Tax=Glaciecola sp. MF2-115 TaxID=3384827 RepID=UPI0039A24DF0
MKKLILVSLLSLACSSAVMAQNGPNPYKDCGIGAALFASTPWAAVTSNVIWDVGTTAVISATASPETCSGSEYATAVFINETYESLEQNFVQGEGQFIDTLSSIMSCDTDSSTALTQEVREMMIDQDNTDKTRLEKAENMYLNIMGTQAAKSCSTNV